MSNKEIAERFKINEEFIEKRTGIKQRYFAEDETIEYMATKATLKLIEKTKINVQEIGLIIVATTSTNRLMPGISNYIQKELKIKCCICLDILSGCSGYINAVDIAQMYINSGKVEKAVAGQVHYCPEGHSHYMENLTEKELVYFAVVPELR